MQTLSLLGALLGGIQVLARVHWVWVQFPCGERASDSPVGARLEPVPRMRDGLHAEVL